VLLDAGDEDNMNESRRRGEHSLAIGDVAAGREELPLKPESGSRTCRGERVRRSGSGEKDDGEAAEDRGEGQHAPTSIGGRAC
jgi:hypothetical protein